MGPKLFFQVLAGFKLLYHHTSIREIHTLEAELQQVKLKLEIEKVLYFAHSAHGDKIIIKK